MISGATWAQDSPPSPHPNAGTAIEDTRSWWITSSSEASPARTSPSWERSPQ